MQTTTAKRLEGILARLERGGATRAAAEREAEAFLKELPPEELVRAEEELARRGFSHARMRHLCPSHVAAVGGDEARQRFRERLPEGHVLATLMDEHLRLLAQVARLTELAQGLDGPDRPDRRETLETMRAVAEHLIGAEPHHQREERVLFPELVDLGIEGPPRVMELEHVELRAMKKAVRDLAAEGLAGDASAVAKLPERVHALAQTLREHVAKEDGILYPLAHQAIDASRWTELRRRCDEIGYCCQHHG